MWFSWSTPQMIIGACAKVGFLQNKVAPELIDRSNFIDKPTAASASASASATPAADAPTEASPNTRLAKAAAGKRAGSAAALAAQLDEARAIIKEKDAVVHTLDYSSIPGLLEPKRSLKPKRTRDQGFALLPSRRPFSRTVRRYPTDQPTFSA